ncbi:hypothetical protein PCK2_000110 [Pneumocystis canis]|nr:hypothetical protein PCK2_000110 [Pneumocystis canis]
MNDETNFRNQNNHSLPGATKTDLSIRKLRPEIRTRAVKFAPNGRSFAVASTEGLLIYSLDDLHIFDPYQLDIEITPQTIRKVLLKDKDYLKAMIMAFRLNEHYIIHEVYESIPFNNIKLISRELPIIYLDKLLKFIISVTETSPHRLRQHNGDIVSGAHKTIKGRPWNMVCLVYGFPSVVSALQFEWAWQNPYITLKIQEKERIQLHQQTNPHDSTKPISRKQGMRVSLKMRIHVLYNMLTMNAWKHWPLKIKIFDQHTWKLWETLHHSIDIKISPITNTKKNKNLNTKHFINNIENNHLLDSKKILDQKYSVLEKIDLNQDEISQIAFRILKKIKEKNTNICMICQAPCNLPELDSHDAILDYSQLIICPTEDCLSIFHLLCLAQWNQSPETENDILIDSYKCLSCEKKIIWGDCIRLQYCILRKTNFNLEEIEV